MLMTRFAYLCATVIIIVLNGAAVVALYRSSAPVDTFVAATLIINLVSWPLAIVIAYRVGQVTGVEYFRKARAKVAAQHGLRT